MSLSLEIMCPSTGSHEPCVQSWKDTMDKPWTVTVDETVDGPQAGYLQKVHRFYLSSQADVIAYFHSDLTIHQPSWDSLVLKEFEDERVAIVSFGGAISWGHPDIYRVPYEYRQLARHGWMSNATDAEQHGTRCTTARDVAVIDSMAVVVRRSFLTRCGGWPVATFPPSHCSDYWLCLMAHRLGMRIRLVPVAYTHTSGGVRGDGRFDYPKWIAGTRWLSDANCHRIGHELIYDLGRDTLPVEIK